MVRGAGRQIENKALGRRSLGSDLRRGPPPGMVAVAASVLVDGHEAIIAAQSLKEQDGVEPCVEGLLPHEFGMSEGAGSVNTELLEEEHDPGLN